MSICYLMFCDSSSFRSPLDTQNSVGRAWVSKPSMVVIPVTTFFHTPALHRCPLSSMNPWGTGLLLQAMLPFLEFKVYSSSWNSSFLFTHMSPWFWAKVEKFKTYMTFAWTWCKQFRKDNKGKVKVTLPNT